jgi:hypothetical protein
MKNESSNQAQKQALRKTDVSGSLPDIYSGELNTERIKQYKHLAKGYNVSESTVRDIFCRGAEWYKHILSNDR